MTEQEKVAQRQQYAFNLNPSTVYGYPIIDETGRIMTCMPLPPGMTREQAVEMWKEALA